MLAVIFLNSSEWASVFLISPHFSPQDPLYYFCLVPSLPFVLLSVSVSWLENKLLSSFVVGVFVEGAERKLGQEQNKRQLLHLPWLNFTPWYSVTTHTHTQTHGHKTDYVCHNASYNQSAITQLHKQTSSRWQWSTAQHRPVKIQLSITLPKGPHLLFYTVLLSFFVANFVCSQHWQYCYNPSSRFMHVMWHKWSPLCLLKYWNKHGQ